MIGTLNEGALHAQLKEWYRQPGDLLEQEVGGYVIDLVRGDQLVEFQTGGFAPLRKKLAALAEEHRVRLVAPIAVSRRIVKVSDAGEILSSRRSPRKGCLHDVFDRLVSIPALIAHPNFELEVLLTHQRELRMFEPGRAYRRRRARCGQRHRSPSCAAHGVLPPRDGRDRAGRQTRRRRPLRSRLAGERASDRHARLTAILLTSRGVAQPG